MPSIVKKPVWIVLAIVLGSCVLCCGGVALFVPGAFKAVMGEIQAADEFGTKTVVAVTKDWSIDELAQRSTPQFSRTLQDPASKGVFDSFKTTYGGFRSGQSQVTGINAKTEAGQGSRTVVKYNNNATFEKSSANIVLTLVKESGGSWKVDGIHINGVGLGTQATN